MQIRNIGEFRLIESIARMAPPAGASVRRGIGDDAAVIQAGPGRDLLITTDAMVESVHFTLDTTTPRLLGRKSLAVNLSDIAAMGGEPGCFVVSLAVPPRVPVGLVRGLYRGMRETAARHGVSLVGGDTVSSPHHLTITVTAVGTVAAGRAVTRSGARPGDLLYVSGTLGDSALGLQMLTRDKQVSRRVFAVRRHLDPTARVELGAELGSRGLASAMIDISDGLTADVRHILQQSRVGATVYCERLPLSASYRKHAGQQKKDCFSPALSGGEDYELLFTVRPEKRAAVERIEARLGVMLTCIGDINASRGRLTVRAAAGGTLKMRSEGFRHF